MLIAGTLEVSDTGAAVYSIPITVPPGTAGMEPKLQLTYNSRGGYGLVGIGWSLDGLPAITRCPRTIAQDGVRGSVKYDSNDRFCLDGQRLIVVNGGYGANNAEYRTERDGFSQIFSYGTAGNGPSWFKVRTKSGQTMEFGNDPSSTNNSRIEAQGYGNGNVRVWAVNRVLDTKSNYIDFVYTKDTANGDYYPAQINYTGNLTAGTAPYAQVVFVTEPRPNQWTQYQAGSIVIGTKRLKNIQTKVNGNLVFDYQLGYEISSVSQRSQLTAVHQCTPAGSCLGTAIDWQGAFTFAPAAGPNWNVAGNNLILGDWNADGRTDVLLQTQSTASNAMSYTVMTDTSGLFSIGGTGFAGWGNYNILGGDWNRDGCADIFLQSRFSNPIGNHVELGNCGGSFSDAWQPGGWEQYNLIAGDWNGDGSTDLFLQYVQNQGYNQNLGELSQNNGSFLFDGVDNPAGWDSYNLIAGDWNGDGCTDLFLQGKWTGLTSQSWPSACPGFQGLTGSGGAWTADNFTIITGDWNGDGCTDLLLQAKTASLQSQAVWSNCTGYFQGSGDVQNGWHSYNLIAGDFNGDGRTDVLLQPKPGTGYPHWLMIQQGGGFQGTMLSVPWTGCSIQAADFNGDGATDVLVNCNNGANTNTYVTTYQPELVKRVTNTLGMVTTITYDYLSKGAPLYTKEAATYPSPGYQGPLYVVSAVDASNGVGGTYRTTYSYVGARFDMQGRGFLGFRQVLAQDQQTSILQTTTYLQPFPYTGLVASRVKQLGSTVLNNTTNTYASTNSGSAPTFVSLTQRVEASFELDGTSMPVVTTGYHYDTWGNPDQISVSTPDGYNKTTLNTYDTPDLTNWILGRLNHATVTSTTP